MQQPFGLHPRLGPEDAIMERNRQRLESQGLEGELLTDQLKALRSQAQSWGRGYLPYIKAYVRG